VKPPRHAAAANDLVVDSSALVGVLLEEAWSGAYLNALLLADVRIIGSFTLMESTVVIQARKGAAFLSSPKATASRGQTSIWWQPKRPAESAIRFGGRGGGGWKLPPPRPFLAHISPFPGDDVLALHL